MLEQFTCATASVRQLVTKKQWEVGGGGREKKRKEKKREEKGNKVSSAVMALFFACNKTYHMWGNS
jgi:hypothetical protein